MTVLTNPSNKSNNKNSNGERDSQQNKTPIRRLERIIKCSSVSRDQTTAKAINHIMKTNTNRTPHKSNTNKTTTTASKKRPEQKKVR
jgi:hypothetical protein